jgi:hypothetical protein
MNLEIQKPELAQRVQAQIQSGHFEDADDLLERPSTPSMNKSTAATSETATGAVLLAAL